MPSTPCPGSSNRTRGKATSASSECSLTAGENAEAYFSFAGDELIFQSTRPPHGCDQIFVLDIDTAESTLASTGTGRTTCAYFLPNDEWIV